MPLIEGIVTKFEISTDEGISLLRDRDMTDMTIPVKEVLDLLNEHDLLKTQYDVLRQNFRVALDLLIFNGSYGEVSEFIADMKELYGEEFVRKVQGCRSD